MGHRYESKPPLFIYLPIYDYMNQTRYKCPIVQLVKKGYFSALSLLIFVLPLLLMVCLDFISLQNIKHQVIHLKAKIRACILDNENMKIQIIFYARILLHLRGRVVEEREAKRRELEGVRGGKVNLS